MSTAFVNIPGASDSPPLLADVSDLPFKANVVSLQTRRSMGQAALKVDSVEGEAALFQDKHRLEQATRRELNIDQIIGDSPALRRVLEVVKKVAPTDSTVLITGETGTGKELVAQAIHRRSPRSNRPLVKVNCAALPAELIASELFGHERGAFTGALKQRVGRFEAANGGTIFLDEIAELSPEIQVSLLRVLQEREFERLGGNRTIKTDVRVIAATNKDLRREVREGRFRMDLFYRLNVFPIYVPPLRERVSDIAILVDYFAAQVSGRTGKKISHIEKESLSAIQQHSWPGNIRELQNVIECGVILSDSEVLRVDPRMLIQEPLSSVSALPATDRKGHIESVLRDTRGKVFGPSGAAARLGMPATTLDSQMRALGINKHHFK